MSTGFSPMYVSKEVKCKSLRHTVEDDIKHDINVLRSSASQYRHQVPVPICQRRSRLLELALHVPHNGFDALQELSQVSFIYYFYQSTLTDVPEP